MWPNVVAVAQVAVLAWTLSRLFGLVYDLIRGYSMTGGVPGPVKWPLLGNLVELWNGFDLQYHQYLRLTRRFGQTYVMALPFAPRYYFTTSPANLEWALKTKFSSYVKGPEIHHILSDLLGDGIFAVDGEKWQAQRKTASYIFNVKNFRDYFLQVFKDEGATLRQILRNSAHTGTVVDLHKLFHAYTMDSFCRIGFGKSTGSLTSLLTEGMDSGVVPFARAFDDSQSIIDARFWNPFWRITERLDGKRTKMAQYVRTMDEFANGVIRERRADPDSDSYSDLLSRFMNYKREEGTGYTDRELRDIVLNLIIAGRDTTAQALSWTFYNLHQSPEVVEKIRAEVDQVLDGADDATQLDFEQLKALQYTKAAFSETLRLHPSVPNQAKMAVEDDTWPDGTVITKGNWIAMSSWAMGRLESLWGQDAAEYKPERYLAEPNPSQFKFLAFNGGPRLCLGMQMAYLEAVLAIAIVASEFDFELAVPSDDIVYGSALTLPMRNGLPMRVSLRSA